MSAAPFRDRVVHHALCNVTEGIFENTFLADSYANRVGKGTHAALDKAQAWTRRYPYVLQCDIRQFFPSIDHAVLEAVLSRKIADEAVLRLIRLIIHSGEGWVAHCRPRRYLAAAPQSVRQAALAMPGSMKDRRCSPKATTSCAG